MTQKEKLANRYIELRKQFDGEDFKPGLSSNQLWYLVKNFKVVDLQCKIEAVEKAIIEKDERLKVEAYYETEEGKLFKHNTEFQMEALCNKQKQIHEEFENWIITEVNKLVPGNWTADLHIGYKSGNVEIGLVNRDPERNFKMEFGHNFTIYYDMEVYSKKSPRFELNYGTLGSFDLFNDELRLFYLNGLASISNNKEWLKLLLSKFEETVNKINDLEREYDVLSVKLKNPFKN